MSKCHVAIIGAGPYGLSIAAHLKACGVSFRIFGKPMHTWMTQMPEGMRLKSEGFASSLYDPDSAFTLGEYCRKRTIPYADLGMPVPLSTFVAYGLEFQKRYVPDLENKLVVRVERSSAGFRIQLDDGEVALAEKVVVAVGISHFGYIPPILSALPEKLVTHSSQHCALDEFRGSEVAVVGAGASALDLAALLRQAGASVQLIARKRAIRFHDPPQENARTLFDKLRAPITGLGPGWKLYFFANAPSAFRHLPQKWRLDLVKKVLGPAPGWFIKEQVVGNIPFHLGVEINRVNVQNRRVNIELSSGADGTKTLSADHVIAATGYRVNLRRLTFLAPIIESGIRLLDQSPVLSSNFESSIPGLYFVGTSAANTFGPLMRFAFGAGFTSRRLAKHLAKAKWDISSTTVETLERDEVACR